MHFEIEHRFDAPIDEVAAAILDEDFQAGLGDVVSTLEAREVLSQEEAPDGTVVRRARCVLGVDLGAAKRFIGDAEPAWVETATWDPAAHTWTWVVEPEIAAEILSSNGSIELVDEGDKTLRRVTGDVKVRVPLYGGRVEKMIVENMTAAYEAEADHLQGWLGRA